ncbi:glycoside-pentoside-hexuronide (GPH):cation symporter [Citrobacter amalonaticus]|uniref:MFS transporter n=1 Tax=Citrobacter amalonaticus TaxID=35703 RepID=UPI00300C7C3E
MDSGQSEKLRLKTVVSYTLGGIADNTIFVMIVTFLMLYYTDTVGIPAATVATIFLITRIWDTFSDLIWGWIFDNTRTRWGKFRPWLLFGGIACALSLIATYSVPALSMTGKIAWVYLTYFMLSTSYTSFDVPYWALSTVLTRDSDARNRLVFITRTAAMCGQWLASLITLPLLALMSNSWSRVSVIYALFILICAIINFMNTREIKTAEHTSPHHSPKVYGELLTKNRPLIILMSFWFIFNLVISSRVGFGLYYFKYIFNSETAMASYLGLSTFLALIGAVVTAPLSHKLGKLNLCRLTSVLLGLTCIILFFQKNSTASSGVLLQSLPSFFLGMLGVVLGAMLPDTVAWHEYTEKKCVEGMIFSLNLFQLKLSGAIGGSATGYILAFVNYVPNAQQGAFTLNGINASFTLIPGILFLLSTFILAFYDLSERRNKEVSLELKLRDGSARG